MSQNGTIFGLLGFAVLLAAGTGWGGYRVGYDRAALESKVELAAKEAELSAAKAAPAPRGRAGSRRSRRARPPGPPGPR